MQISLFAACICLPGRSGTVSNGSLAAAPVYWTERVARLEKELRSALPKTPPGTVLEFWITGTISDRARSAGRELGWVVHEVPEAAAEPAAQ